MYFISYVLNNKPFVLLDEIGLLLSRQYKLLNKIAFRKVGSWMS